MEDKAKPGYSDGIFSFMTTEHFTLQSARSIINQEITSRVSSYFMTLSSILIATAFLAQFSENRQLFVLFSLIAYPLLLFLGEMTFMRIMQLGIMDSIYIRAINQVRHFYIQAAPESENHLLFPPFDDDISISKYGGYRFSVIGNLLSSGFIVGTMNIVIGVVLLGVVLHNSFHLNLQLIIPLGLVLIILLMPLQGFIASRIIRRDIPENHLKARFPIARYDIEPASQ